MFVDLFRLHLRNAFLPKDISISFDIRSNTIFIMTDSVARCSIAVPGEPRCWADRPPADPKTSPGPTFAFYHIPTAKALAYVTTGSC
jgi:hypothetical protein